MLRFSFFATAFSGHCEKNNDPFYLNGQGMDIRVAKLICAENTDRLMIIIGLATLVVSPFFIVPGLVHFSNIPPRAAILSGAALVMIVWALKSLVQKSAGFRLDRLTLIILFFLGWCWFSLFWAKSLFDAFYICMNWSSCALFFLLFSHLSLAGLEKVQKAFLILIPSAVTLMAVIGLCQAFFGLDIIPQAYPPGSVFSNKNMAVHVMVMGLGTCYVGMIACNSLLKRGIYTAAALISTMYVILTCTRTGWLAVIILTLFFFCFYYFSRRTDRRETEKKVARRVWMIPAVIAVAVVCLVYNPIPYDASMAPVFKKISKTAELIENPNKAATGRLTIWKTSLKMWQDRPLHGFGIRNQKIHYPRYEERGRTRNAPDPGMQVLEAHNDFLQIMVETGGVGVLLMIGMLSLGIFTGVAAASRSGLMQTSGMVALAASAGLLALSVEAFFSFPFYRPIPPLWCFAFLGLINALRADTHPSAPWSYDILIPRIPAAMVCVGLAIFLIGFAYRDLKSEVYYSKARLHGDNGRFKEAAEYGEKALGQMPWRQRIAVYLAAGYLETGRYEKGKTILSGFIQSNPYWVKSLENLGNSEAALGNTDAALGYFEKIIAFKPRYLPAYFYTGLTYLNMKESEKALEWFEKLARLNPESDQAYYHIGLCHMMKQRFRHAEAAFIKALARNPALEAARGNLAVL